MPGMITVVISGETWRRERMRVIFFSPQSLYFFSLGVLIGLADPMEALFVFENFLVSCAS